MKNIARLIFVFLIVLSISCKTESENKKNIISSTTKSKDGTILLMEFDTIKDIAYITFEGKKEALPSQRPASGMWYKNEHFELRGKGNKVDLKKDGKLVFTSYD